MSLHAGHHGATPRRTLIEAALFLAQQWPVFACGADKRPITPHGFKDATRDPVAIREMFSRPGAALIGVPTGEASDLAVIDLDVKDGAPGLEWLAAHTSRLPRTRQHATRSGGRHLLFRYPVGRRIRNSVRGVAPGVDVRGQGGYIIAPPSDGYTVHDDAMPEDMPAWLVDLLDPPQPPPAARPAVSREWRDTSERGSRYGMAALSDEADAICNAPFGAQETTLNNAGLKIGALIAGGELEAGFARETLIRAGLAMSSQPGERAWSPEEIRRKVERAIADGQRAPRQAPPREVRHTVRVEIVPPEAPPYDEPPPHIYAEPDMAMDSAERGEWEQERKSAHLTAPAPFETLTLDQIEAMQPPAYLVAKLLPEGSFALILGPWASLKSFLSLDLALCIAYGLPWQGRDVQQGPVLYIAGEGAAGLGRRIRAWRAVHCVEDQAAPFRLLPLAVSLMQPQQVARIVATMAAIAEAEGAPLRLVVIDTLARSMIGGDENTALDMGRAVAGIDELRQVGCCTLTVHHMGKDKDRGARGSSALPGAADTMIEVERSEMRLTVKVTKQKEDEEGDPIELEARKVGLDGGEPQEGAPTSLVLVGADAGASPSRSRTGRLSGDQAVALDILRDALASSGRPGDPGVPAGAVSIPEKWWRDRFYERAKPGAEQDAKQKSFRRAADALLAGGHIGMFGSRIWVT